MYNYGNKKDIKTILRVLFIKKPNMLQNKLLCYIIVTMVEKYQSDTQHWMCHHVCINIALTVGKKSTNNPDSGSYLPLLFVT